MKCPHCGKDIPDKLVVETAASINGRRSRRALAPEEARRLAELSHQARRDKKARKAAEAAGEES